MAGHNVDSNRHRPTTEGHPSGMTPCSMRPGTSRYAPSPTSDLHIGNLRTALLAWLFARHSGRQFLLRIEDLDRQRVVAAGVEQRQLADLAAIGIDFDGETVRQSERGAVYAAAAHGLRGLTYECFCSRREIAEAVRAPHGATAFYPGTCRDLTAAERAERRAARPPHLRDQTALRIRADSVVQGYTDVLHGPGSGVVDDFVIRRGDGVWAYNFAVVVDDVAAGVDQVVRGDDLLDSSPRQAWLTERLGGTVPAYVHVPLVLNADGVRLAKRDQATTLTDLAGRGVEPAAVLSAMAHSLGLADPGEPVDPALLLERFDPERLPREPWRFVPDELF